MVTWGRREKKKL